MNVRSILIEESVSRYAFLLSNDNKTILIDPGSKLHAEKLIPEIEQTMKIKDIDYIILQSNDYLNITAVPALIEAGFNGKIICNETSFKYVEEAVNYEATSIASLDYKLVIDETEALTFIPAPFLPFYEGFLTYDGHEHSLFSSHLFSQDNTDLKASLARRVNNFHERIMPSVEFVRQTIKKIRDLQIYTIYPRLGETIGSIELNDLVKSVMNYDFYNTSQVVEKVNEKNMSYNYETICNHMLRKLTSFYARDEILDVFVGSKLSLILMPDIEIESSELKGYRLWNYFFERIHEKKGIPWLVMLEPTVKKYNKLYKIHKPAIYTTQSYEQQSKIKALNEQTGALSKQVQTLQTDLKDTTDKLLRDDITNLYNERFMTEYLYKEMSKESDQVTINALALVQIDNLLSINKKYGTAQGDETLRNLAYVLKNNKDEADFVFKQFGPGIFVFIAHIKPENLEKYVLKLRNVVQESELFIEPVTASISIVEVDEIDQRYEDHQRTSLLIDLVRKRMERAKTLGKSQIIDKSQDNEAYIEGHILLVDEDETYQNMMKKIFDRIHYEVIIASDIYDAFELLKTSSIDMIISEINMSKLDGFQFKHMINQTKDYKNIPFIIASHHKDLDVVTRANLLDIDLILQKPIIPEELLGHINRMRQRRKSL